MEAKEEEKVKESGEPITLDELVGHYKQHFMTPEYFRELLELYLKQGKLTDDEIETKIKANHEPSEYRDGLIDGGIMINSKQL